MKFLTVLATVLLIYAVLIISCANKPHIPQDPESETDSLKAEIEFIKEHYKPGLGEIMNTIQLHHAKLWYAGIHEDWDLASFEIDELTEMFDKAQTIETDRPEIKDIPMIREPIASLRADVDAHNVEAFRSEFKLLTQTCNTCHQKNHFGFNKIIIPTSPPVTNQEF